MDKYTKEQTALRVSYRSIVINSILSVFKIITGIFARSGAMLSDGVHSASDVMTTLVVIAGVRISGRASDKKHPYGHERMECVAAILLSAVLLATGLGIGYAGIKKVVAGGMGETLAVPGAIALAAAVISFFVKEIMFRYTIKAAKKINSSALRADAWHHRSDALSSAGSFAGILGSRLGLPILDPVAGVLICVFVVKAAVDIFIDSIGKMTDNACDEETVRQLHELILTQEGVLEVEKLKTRLFGDKIYVDAEICANGHDTLIATHEVAHRVHDAVEGQFKNVKHCMVHVSPAKYSTQKSE